jgi:tetratricopeptide (TPR) repeat protein
VAALGAVRPDSAVLARAESLLVRGRLPEARAVLEQVVRHNPSDPAALVLLGRVHLAWPVVGRFKAWHLFEEAARLDSRDPEPRYQQVQVGLALGGADGERLARDALFKILEIVPDYRDVWRIWHLLYEGDGHRRHAIRLLAQFDDPASALRRADLLIRLEDYQSADSVLAVLARRCPDDPAVLALRAESAFETGDAADGESYYWRAVARSARDTADRLWHQIEAIASPEEEGLYWVTPPDGRPEYFQRFWARREPDLTTPLNERLAEHFMRLRHARRDFALLQPQSTFHRSPLWRALQGGRTAEILDRLGDFTVSTGVLPGHSALEDELTRAGVGVDLRDLPEPDSITRYARLGFDGRGLMYLRFGAPQERLISVGPGVDVEAWRYVVDGRNVSLVFARATAGGGSSSPGGDFVLYPTNARELHNTAMLLERDAPSRAATLPLAVWVAFFRAADSTAASSGFHDVVIRTSPDSAGVAMWDLGDQEIVRAAGASPFTLRVRDGVYHFGADAHIGPLIGSVRRPMVVPPLGPGWLSVSSLLLAVTRDTAPGRLAMARAMPADLVIERRGRPLTLYTEVYDLPDRRGMADYDVVYTFEPVGRGSRVTFAFSRTVPATTTVIERLVVQPGQVPPGRYRVTLAVRDRVFGLRGQAVSLEVTLR